jgi:hypothetical protein
MLDELRLLLSRAVAVVFGVADADTAWSTPWAHSGAGKELAVEEARRPAPHNGSWPWLAAPMIGRWALQVAAEEATGFSKVLEANTTSYAADVLCRSVLETASLAWWLLDPGIDGPQRTARSLVYRLHTARQTARAVDALDLESGDDRSGYGESVADVQSEITDPGWTSICNKYGVSVSFGATTESWPSYTERAARLIEKIWPQRDLPYAVLSAVAHAELLGLARNLTRLSPAMAGLRSGPGLDAAVWLWQDTYLVLGALVFTADRAASFLGLPDHLDAIHAVVEQLDERLLTLRPSWIQGLP